MDLSQPRNQGWDVEGVADITLTDGSQCSGVLIGVSSSASILDRWDDTRRAPAGDPFTLDLAAVAVVVIP
jgi:hypothetical protein